MATIDSSPSTDPVLKCSWCSAQFATRGQRDLHADRIHRTSVNVKFRSGASWVAVRDCTGRFRCRCNRTYTSGRSIQRHSRTCDFSEGAMPNEGRNLPASLRNIDWYFKVLGSERIPMTMKHLVSHHPLMNPCGIQWNLKSSFVCFVNMLSTVHPASVDIWWESILGQGQKRRRWKISLLDWPSVHQVTSAPTGFFLDRIMRQFHI